MGLLCPDYVGLDAERYDGVLVIGEAPGPEEHRGAPSSPRAASCYVTTSRKRSSIPAVVTPTSSITGPMKAGAPVLPLTKRSKRKLAGEVLEKLSEPSRPNR